MMASITVANNMSEMRGSCNCTYNQWRLHIKYFRLSLSVSECSSWRQIFAGNHYSETDNKKQHNFLKNETKHHT